MSQILENYPFTWGLAGSTGFELVSGIETTTSNSDIDIIMRKSSRLTVSIAKRLKKELETIPVRVDVQVESNEGAFSLSEFVMSVGKDLLLRTQDGPILIRKCLLQSELES